MLQFLDRLKVFNKKRVWVSLLIAVDLLAVALAAVVSIALRQSEMVRSFAGNIEISEQYFYAFAFAAVFLAAFYAANTLYAFKNIKRIRETLLLMKAHAQWVVALMASAYLYQYDYSRLIFFLFAIFSFIFCIGGRFAVHSFRNWLLKGQIGIHHVVIVGKGKTAKDLERALIDHYGRGVRIICNVIPELYEGSVTVPVEGLRDVVRNYSLVTVYIAEPQLSHEYILELISGFPTSNVQFKIVADIFLLATGNFNVSNIDEIPSLDLTKVTPSWWHRTMKRTIDIVLGATLFIVSLPLWLLVALLIKIDSKGPVLIFQNRIGHKGKPFVIWKFRTMQNNVALYDISPRKQQDARITRVGALLRRTSLDELPQLVNVLKGEMSLVGPRPEMPFIVEKYTSWQRKRLEAKPGLTGLWQILGRKDLPLAENLEYDFYYINNQGVLLDLVILAKTIPVVLFGRGAY